MISKIKNTVLLSLLTLLAPIYMYAVEIVTPLRTDTGGTTIEGLFKMVLGAILDLSAPIIVLAIVYVGFLFIKAQGNESELTKAKEALVMVLIGIAVIIASNALYNIFYAGIN